MVRTEIRKPSVLRGGVARLAELLVTPLVPSDYVDLLSPLRSSAALRARVVEIRPETPDAVTIVLRPGRGWAGHTPGEWVRVGVDVDGVRLWRAYSLTSPSRADGLLTITVKEMAGGKVSGYLVRRARPGLLVHLHQATGDFVLPEIPPTSTLFITAGSGITPVMGMLRSALHQMPDVVVVHSAPRASDVIFGCELRELAATGRLRLIEQHTDVDGMLTPDALMRRVPDWRDRQTWACGPIAMLNALENHWADHGVASKLHIERFQPSFVAAGHGGTATFARSGVTVTTDPATPLLSAGEEAGVLMPSGCRMGICFGCVAPLKHGAVRDLRSGAVTTTADGEHVLVQTCVSTAAGDCIIDL
jgi:ferredoxin-NADP reductase